MLCVIVSHAKQCETSTGSRRFVGTLTREDTPADGDVAGEGALLVNVGACSNSHKRGLITEALDIVINASL